MIRSDLYWSLWATLPHAAKAEHGYWPVVGIEVPYDGHFYTYATDTYTMGLTRRPADLVGGQPLSVQLGASEATDLARYVRPGNKKQEQERVRLIAKDDELHVGLVNTEGDIYDSAVFDTVATPYVSRDWVREQIREHLELPRDHRPLVFDPDLAARFGRAKRQEGDRLTFHPVLLGEKVGIGIAVVGDSFVGAVAGMLAVDAESVLTAVLGPRENADGCLESA